MRHEGRELPNVSLRIFTPAELRVIRVIFSMILSEGQCTKRLDEIAALASASRSTVVNSIKEAVYHGILECRERRFGNAVSEPNVLTAAATSAQHCVGDIMTTPKAWMDLARSLEPDWPPHQGWMPKGRRLG